MHLNQHDFNGSEEAIWHEANHAGVTHGVVIGYDIQNSQKAIGLAERLPNLYASVGVSPHDAQQAPENYIDTLRQMAQHPKVVAIGEAGLEYHHPVGPKEMQIEHFNQQARLADELQKPIVIHLRDADEDFLHILETAPPQSAILHCFTASQAVMEKAVSLGYYISFSGILTFKNAKDIQSIAPLVPEQNILIETDSPYLAPVPYRGKRCEPPMLVETAKKLADLREISFEEISTITFQNACQLFKIDE